MYLFALHDLYMKNKSSSGFISYILYFHISVFGLSCQVLAGQKGLMLVEVKVCVSDELYSLFWFCSVVF